MSNPKYKNMSNSPEKNDPPTSAIVNTSTNLGKVNLNVVLNRLNQPLSVNSDSDIEMIPPEKLETKQTNSEIQLYLFHISSPVYRIHLYKMKNGSIL